MIQRCCFIRHLFLLILLVSTSCVGTANPISLLGFRNGQQQQLSVNRPAGRSLLHYPELTEPNTKLVVDRSGKVSLLQQSGKPIWSFSSGSPLYSSYHAPLNADNNNNTDNASEKLDVGMEDDGMTLGSETTTYLLDGLSGRLIHVSKSGDDKTTNAVVKPTSAENFVKLPLLIMRTNSKLEHFDNTTGKLMWNVTVSHFRAALLCDPAFNSGDELGPEILTGIYMPLQCGSQTDIRALLKSDSAYEAKRLPSQQRIGNENNIYLPSARTREMRESRKLREQHGKNDAGVFGKFSEWSPLKLLVPLLFMGVVISVYVKRFSSRGSDLNIKSGPSKKKKNRKSGKDSITNEQRDRQLVPPCQDQFQLIEGGQMVLGLNNILSDGRKIGKLFVSNKEIAKGSNGTVVFEGNYEGRPVAVKRLVRSHHEVAFKEIQNLIASDQHSNIIRWYGVEYDRDFVYLSLERCSCSLDDLIKTYLEFSMTKVLGNSETTEVEFNIQLDSLEGFIRGNNLWKVGGHPSPLMLKLMRDIVLGLAHLHELGIVHRDLKPQNVLITKGTILSAKLSDMGISKRLSGDMLSLGHLATGCGSSGWQAPEQLLQGRQTRAVDMFSLGCVLFYFITGCKHPFGDDIERDINIVNNKVDLFLIEHVPEASDLISRLLSPNPDLRPSAAEVLLHPMFWNSEMRLSFLRDASDRVELENREADSEILKAMENTAPVAIGGKWDEKLEPVFITNIGRYRRYKYDSIRDLLRVIRNKLNHYRELPLEIQELVGTVPEGFDEYFAVRFPKLLIEVYKVISLHCREEEVFRKHFKSNVI